MNAGVGRFWNATVGTFVDSEICILKKGTCENWMQISVTGEIATSVLDSGLLIFNYQPSTSQ